MLPGYAAPGRPALAASRLEVEKTTKRSSEMATIPEARPSHGAEREVQVRTLFSEIAPRYDLLNHVLSLNIDRGWRRRAIRMLGWQERDAGRYLDACAGTFDLSLELAKQDGFRGSVVATDFALPMLVQGRDKLCPSVTPICGDTLRLPFAGACFGRCDGRIRCAQSLRLTRWVLSVRSRPLPGRPTGDSGVHGAAEPSTSRPLPFLFPPNSPRCGGGSFRGIHGPIATCRRQ